MYKHLPEKLFINLVAVFLFSIPIPNLSYGQACGGIINTANNTGLGNPAILDPNGDGRIANTTTGRFTNGTNELAEFEQLTGSATCECERDWARLPSVSEEPQADINTGGTCGNTDIISDNDGGDDHAYFTVFENKNPETSSGLCSFSDLYIAFRIRIADQSSGNFSFSILVSNDGALVGEQVLNPDGTTTGATEGFQCCGAGKATNVGFEREIQLQKGGIDKGINVWNINNTSGTQTLVTNYGVTTNTQVAFACGQDPDCTNTPVFYTFTLPLTALGFQSCDHFINQFAAAAVSGSSGLAVIAKCTSTSDIGGVAGQSDPDCSAVLPCELPSTPACPSDCNLASGRSLLCAANVLIQLPVELINFSAKLASDKVDLSWSTASEQNNLGFDLERSTDGRNWETLDFVPGRGTTSETNYYTYEDKRPAIGNNYYRLKQIDYDGRFEYSEVVQILLRPQKGDLLSVFPNPSNGLFRVSLMNPNQDRAVIRLLDSTGSEIWAEQFNRAEAEIYWEKDFNLPQREVYFLVTQVGSKTESQKIVVIDKN